MRREYEHTECHTVISLVVAFSNGIAMILMYLRYIQIVSGAFVTLRDTESGEWR